MGSMELGMKEGSSTVQFWMKMGFKNGGVNRTCWFTSFLDAQEFNQVTVWT